MMCRSVSHIEITDTWKRAKTSKQRASPCAAQAFVLCDRPVESLTYSKAEKLQDVLLFSVQFGGHGLTHEECCLAEILLHQVYKNIRK
jgi:hypothetical protein